MRLLIAEDDTTLREGLGDLMTAEGFDCHLAADGQAALTCFEAAPFPVVILDVVMPGRDGLSLCRHIRCIAPQTQIMMLSARGESFDKTIGLEHGADDYLAKPFNPAELCARMAAMARRAGRATVRQGFYMDDLWIEPQAFRATRAGQVHDLNRRELGLLQVLYRHVGKPVERDALLNECWGQAHFPNSRALDQYIAALRQKIERFPHQPRIIETVRGIGYRYPGQAGHR